MNIKQTVAFGTKKFKTAKIISASLDAEILLSFVLKKSKEFIYAHPEKAVSNKQFIKFKKTISRRAKDEPVAYILGYKNFYGLKFLVDKEVLIPRPETELLIEEVLKKLNCFLITHSSSLITFLDIGTGSGCIPITIARNLYNAECIKYYGIDNSSKALMVAKQNAKLNNVPNKIKFIKSDLLKNILCIVGTGRDLSLQLQNTNLIITANLPYLSEKIYRHNYKNLKYEPKAALVAGKDGLKYYRQLLKQIKNIVSCHSVEKRNQEKKNLIYFWIPAFAGMTLKGNANFKIIITANLPYLSEKIYHQNYKNLKYEPKSALIAGKDGLKYYRELLNQIYSLITYPSLLITCFFEIDPLQTVSIKKLIKQHFPAVKILIKKDLAGHNRLIVIKLSQKHLT